MNEAAKPTEEPVAYAYVIDGECEEIGWGKPPMEDPSLVLLSATPPVAPTGTVGISDAMVERALDASGHRSTEYSRKWMRAALEAAISAPTVEGDGL